MDLEEQLAERRSRRPWISRPYTELRDRAPRRLRLALPERKTRVRFMLPTRGRRLARRDLGRLRRTRSATSRCSSARRASRRRSRRHLRAQPGRVDRRGAGHPGGRRRDGADLRREHRRAGRVRGQALRRQGASSSTPPALLGRVFEAWDEYAAASSASCSSTTRSTPRAVLAKLRDAGKQVPPFAEVERKLVTWSPRAGHRRRARREEPARLRADDARRLARSAGADALHERHLGQPQGRPAHPPQRRRSTGCDWLKCNAPLLDEGAVDLLWLPMSHIFGFGEACLGNTLGFTTYLCDPGERDGCLPEVRPERVHERARSSGRSSRSRHGRGRPQRARASSRRSPADSCASASRAARV